MSSPTMGAWECRHGVDGRDFCEQCYGGGEERMAEILETKEWLVRYKFQPTTAGTVEEWRYTDALRDEFAARALFETLSGRIPKFYTDVELLARTLVIPPWETEAVARAEAKSA